MFFPTNQTHSSWLQNSAGCLIPHHPMMLCLVIQPLSLSLIPSAAMGASIFLHFRVLRPSQPPFGEHPLPWCFLHPCFPPTHPWLPLWGLTRAPDIGDQGEDSPFGTCTQPLGLGVLSWASRGLQLGTPPLTLLTRSGERMDVLLNQENTQAGFDPGASRLMSL